MLYKFFYWPWHYIFLEYRIHIVLFFVQTKKWKIKRTNTFLFDYSSTWDNTFEELILVLFLLDQFLSGSFVVTEIKRLIMDGYWSIILKVFFFVVSKQMLSFYLFILVLSIFSKCMLQMIFQASNNLYCVVMSTEPDLRDDKQFFIDHPGAVPISSAQVKISAPHILTAWFTILFSHF